jgi:hypothetical protein
MAPVLQVARKHGEWMKELGARVRPYVSVARVSIT